MDTKQIIEADLAKNHDGVSLEQGLSIYNKYLKEGYKPKKIGKTLFIYKVEDTIVKYHSINAAIMKEYVGNVKQFFESLKDYKYAITPLTNDKLVTLIKRYFDKETIQIVKGYAVTDLRSI